VLDPAIASVFIHEAFGHLSEADHVYENPKLRDLLVLGDEIASPILTVADSAAEPALSGSYKYDDEGTPARKNYLIQEGRLVGRLHSRETAGNMNESPTGNARAITYRFPPIVRMTNTFIEAGDVTFQDLLADVDDGVYVVNWLGGQTAMEMFTFRAMEAYAIRNGRLEEPLRGVTLTGNVFETLKNIDAVADDFTWDPGGGGCGKGGQAPLAVGNASPHIRVSKCVIGGV
jgi:TldD protein